MQAFERAAILIWALIVVFFVGVFFMVFLGLGTFGGGPGFVRGGPNFRPIFFRCRSALVKGGPSGPGY